MTERFDYRSISRSKGNRAMNRELVEHAHGKDMVFIGKGELIKSDALQEIRKRGTITILWYGDMRPRPEPWLISLLKQIDVFFMSSGGDCLKEYFMEGKPKRAAYYFNPCDPDFIADHNKPVEKTREIVITGTPGFAKNERISLVEYLLTRNDVCFYGGIELLPLRKKNRLIYLWRKFIGAPVSPWIRGEQYVSVIRSAKIGIGASAFNHVDKYTSDRMTHYLSLGTFYLPLYFPSLEMLFDIGTEVICFHSIEDLDQKIAHYLAEPQEREAIAKRAQQKMLMSYNTENITGMMLYVIQHGTSYRFPWVEVLS
jgi:hypothetical protein